MQESVGQKSTLLSDVAPPIAAPGVVASDPVVGGNGESTGIGDEAGKVKGVSDGDIAEFMDLDKMEDGFARDLVAAGGGRV